MSAIGKSRMSAIKTSLRSACVAAFALPILLGPGVAAANPTEDPNNPYPDLRFFTEISADPYQIPGQGAWFLTANGLNCGIWWRGSFGCIGEQIPGAPPGTRQIGWISGDTRVHFDWTMAARFPQTRGTLSIPPLSFIRSEGTSCGTTVAGDTYCERGPWRMLITSTHTWINGTSHAPEPQ